MIKALQQKDHPFFAGFPKTKRQKTVAEEEKFELQSINLDEYMAGQENAEMIQEQSSLMEQPSAGNLNPKVLVEKELEEARAVFEKHGIIVPEGAAHSRTSSVILGLSSQKKGVEIDGTKSVASSKSKDYHKQISCDLCGKEMRADNFKSHRGSKHCNKK
jgi:hypothetical protein